MAASALDRVREAGPLPPVILAASEEGAAVDVRGRGAWCAREVLMLARRSNAVGSAALRGEESTRRRGGRSAFVGGKYG